MIYYCSITWTIQTDACTEMYRMYLGTRQYKNKNSDRGTFKVMLDTEKGATNTAGLGREGIKKEALELGCESSGRGMNGNI